MGSLSGIGTEATDPFLEWVGSTGGHELKPHENAVLTRAAALIKDIPSREVTK